MCERGSFADRGDLPAVHQPLPDISAGDEDVLKGAALVVVQEGGDILTFHFYDPEGSSEPLFHHSLCRVVEGSLRERIETKLIHCKAERCRTLRQDEVLLPSVEGDEAGSPPIRLPFGADGEGRRDAEELHFLFVRSRSSCLRRPKICFADSARKKKEWMGTEREKSRHFFFVSVLSDSAHTNGQQERPSGHD